MFEDVKFVVVEDKDTDRKEVLSELAVAKFKKDNRIGLPATYDDAKELLAQHAHEIDVVFLDLNIPRNDKDSRPEKAHGSRLLQYIHDDLNRRQGHDVKVIIVSGEELLDSLHDDALYRAYEGTLVSITQKTELTKTLKRSLKRLRKDPLLALIRKADVEIIDGYECVFDGGQPINERLEAARRLAARLVRYEVDHFRGKVGAADDLADDLQSLITEHIESRFKENDRGRRFINASRIEAPGGWPAFLWRGAMVQHLYTINSYRNRYMHIAEQPYDDSHGQNSVWKIPPDTLESVKSGKTVGDLICAVVRDLLAWYLPWHIEVYKPWVEKGGGA
jgi:CheY-like chemotaxis protein